eukprot:3415431-Rhodomonas_salina.2
MHWHPEGDAGPGRLAGQHRHEGLVAPRCNCGAMSVADTAHGARAAATERWMSASRGAQPPWLGLRSLRSLLASPSSTAFARGDHTAHASIALSQTLCRARPQQWPGEVRA